MSSLANCLKKHGGKLSREMQKTIRRAAKEYRAENYSPEVSNLSAIEDFLNDLEVDRADIIRMAEEAIRQ